MINLNDIKAGKATITTITVLNLFVPGGLGIFFLRNDLFISLDIFKLLFLSILLSTPFLLISFFIALLCKDGLLYSIENSSNQEVIKEDTEDNDLVLIVYSNLYSFLAWLFSYLCYLYIEIPSHDSLSTAKEITLNYIYFSIGFTIIISAFWMIRRIKKNK